MSKPPIRRKKVKGLFDDEMPVVQVPRKTAGPPQNSRTSAKEQVPPPPVPPVKRKAGRPRGSRNSLQTMKPKDVRLRHSKYMLKYFGHMTDAEIKKLKPLDLFAGLVFIAVKTRDHLMLREVAKDWAPYEHARKSDAVPLTPDEVIRIVNTARAEAVKRGLDPDVTVGSPLGTKPN